ncbi:MAG: NADAR family protein [Planctomycetota bacterium]
MAIEFYSTRGPHGCFSNFSRHPITIDGETWPTTAHYFQAMKFPDDADRRARIRTAKTAADCKKVAWEKGVPIRADWDTHRLEVMRVALRAKFTQHDDARETLLGTGDEELVEHTSKDRYWGDGGDGRGQNMLGKMLMELRDALRNE